MLLAEEMQLTTSKEEFLSNSKNKQLFIELLMKYLEERHVNCTQAEGDADCLIVNTAIKKSQNGHTVLVGEDTDLLILLLHHAKQTTFSLFLFNQGKKGSPGKLLLFNRT